MEGTIEKQCDKCGSTNITTTKSHSGDENISWCIECDDCGNIIDED